jgi:drug/metabolite transporter (DMT)-like permease
MAVNIALIGTTSSPIVATVLAAVFLKEKITMARIVGMLVCLAGVLLLISKASWNTLLHFQFSKGDAWVIGGAFCFAIYNTLVRKKPSEIPSKAFLWMVFALGTVLLIPFYLAETLGMLTITHTTTIGWNWPLVGSIFYLGLGASVISFLCWNLAIARLGAGRTALFGNLIPVFSSLEAVLFLSEKITVLHYFTGLIIIAGLFIANFSLLFKKKQSE